MKETSADTAATVDAKGPDERETYKYLTQKFKSWKDDIEYTCVRNAGQKRHSITKVNTHLKKNIFSIN
jgi:hypothetical protein